MQIMRADNVDLVAGVATVAEPRVTANTICIYCRRASSGGTGELGYSITPGVGVQFNSASGTDASGLSYILLNKIS